MQKTILIIAFLFSVLGITVEVKASHAAGGEIIYQWVSGSTYHIAFKFYRDCSGAPAPNPQDICAYNTCTGQIITANVTPPPFYTGTNIPNGSPVSVGCAGVGTVCNGGTLPGYEEWWYECDFTLPTQCNNWTFYTGVSVRNAQIDNLGPGPNTYNLFVYATLNNVQAQGNSSPFFTVKPVPYTCVNVPFIYNNGAVDIDGDSLSFEFINPSDGPSICSAPVTTPIAFAPVSGPNNFNNTNNPFATNNTFSFNTSTGEMSFTPTLISENVVTVKVHEYRNGIEIGTILRDIQLNIRPCSVPAPNVQLDTSSIVGDYINGNIEVCAGKPVHFCFEANTSPGRILVVSDNHSYISNNITVAYTNQGTDTVTGCFDWLPGLADTGFHIFVVIVKDSTCDGSGITVTNVLTIPIRVWPGVSITLQGDSVICPGEYSTLIATGGGSGYQWSVLPGGSGIGSINCATCDSVIVSPTITTTYKVYSTSAYGCPDTSMKTIHVDPAPVAGAGNDTIVCGGVPVQLNGSGVGTYNWYPGTGISNTAIANPIFTGSGTSTLNLVVTNQFGCSDTDQVLVTVNPSPIADAGPDVTDCTNGVVQLNGSGGTTCSWYPAGVLNNNNIYNPTMVVVDTTITFTLVVMNSFGCSDTDQVTVSVHNKIAQSDAGIDVSACPGDVVQLQGVGNGSFNWVGSVSNASINNPYYTGSATTTLTLIVTDIFGCSDTDDVQVTILPQPIAVAGPDSSLCSNGVIMLHASGGVNYTWFPTTNMTGANTATPTVTVNENIIYYAVVADTSGCRDTAAVSLSIIPPPTFTASPTQEMCKSDSIMLHASGGINYSWYPDSYISTTFGNEVMVWPTETTTYFVTITEPVCNYKDSLAIQVNVREHPEVKITRADPISCGVNGQLEATGAVNYRWSPAAMLDNSNISNPTSHVSTDTWYYVTGKDEFGCENSDSVLMRIITDDVGGLFVPTVFSPNGDGKNDRYRVVQPMGITDFELHIYNRFGENVYNADDASDSWDGMYKGKICDAGVYYYFYKFKSPACGKTIEGKGDITLVR